MTDKEKRVEIIKKLFNNPDVDNAIVQNLIKLNINNSNNEVTRKDVEQYITEEVWYV